MNRYEVIITPKADSDIRNFYKSGNKRVVRKIEKLVEELEFHPTTGTGKPEQLSGNRSGQWSRRITEKHRLIYEIFDDKVMVLVISAFGHYDDK